MAEVTLDKLSFTRLYKRSPLTLLLLVFLCQERMLKELVRLHPFVRILSYQVLDEVPSILAHCLWKRQFIFIHLLLTKYYVHDLLN